MVPTGYGYVLPDQNGWSRYLHFEAAWILVSTGVVYVIYGFFKGHFRRSLFVVYSKFSAKRLGADVARHLRPWRSSGEEGWSYNPLQRLTYLLVIFVFFPLVIWTGLAMSPAFESAIPEAVTILGGRQSARTLHFLVSLVLALFVLVHVLMVFRAGFRNRMTAMIIGRLPHTAERP
jgi:thiosulfate reductase cytochrome b subunit